MDNIHDFSDLSDLLLSNFTKNNPLKTLDDQIQRMDSVVKDLRNLNHNNSTGFSCPTYKRIADKRRGMFAPWRSKQD